MLFIPLSAGGIVLKDTETKQKYRLLDKVNFPSDLKRMDVNDFPELSKEIRDFLVKSVSKTGGHLASSLGVVELSIALHYIFDTPKDKLVWDVGHQGYVHKMLTGRKHLFHTLKQYKGIAGYLRMSESEYDNFGAGHASTSLSAALGMAKARDMKEENQKVVAIIGDGGLTGGIALEAINQMGYLKTDMITILNDNKMSIAFNVGALSDYTGSNQRIKNTDAYKRIKGDFNRLLERAENEPELKAALLRLKNELKIVYTPGIVFEKLGINYFGPYDGHDVKTLIKVLKEAKERKGPCIIHIYTKKGRGVNYAENDAIAYHGLSRFDPETGKALGKKSISYTNVFADAIVELAKKDKKIVGITAAMPQGTGLAKMQKEIPERFFDVGIAEQHAVTFAAGLAAAGMKPVVAIYSTFLQRAYDQIVHDVCLQNLPVIFALDRAGLVGEDGPTHHGSFDLSYLSTIPNMIIMAPKDENELRHMVYTAVNHDGPIAIRYPRRGIAGVEMDKEMKLLEIGKAEYIERGKDLVIVSAGTAMKEVMETAGKLKEKGIHPTVINARFVKPMDQSIIEAIKNTGKAVVVEENAKKGGFGSAVIESLAENNIKADVKHIALPDRFIEHGSVKILHEKCGLTCQNILQEINRWFNL